MLSIAWLLSNACVLSHFSCVQLCSSLDCSPPSSSVYGILKARILAAGNGTMHQRQRSMFTTVETGDTDPRMTVESKRQLL